MTPQLSIRLPLLGVDLDNVLSASDASMMEALQRVTGRLLAAHKVSGHELRRGRIGCG